MLAVRVVLLGLCLSCSRKVIEKRAEDRPVGGKGEVVSEIRSEQTETILALFDRLSSEDESDRVQAKLN